MRNSLQDFIRAAGERLDGYLRRLDSRCRPLAQ